jgi:predicted transcriptional regulator
MTDYSTQRIVTEMTAKGIKQAEIAAVLGINQSTVSRLLKKTLDNKPRVSNLDTYIRSVQLLDELIAINHPSDFSLDELKEIAALRSSFLNGIRNYSLISKKA